MTTVQTMLNHAADLPSRAAPTLRVGASMRSITGCLLVVASVLLAALAGCEKPELTVPEVTVAPYSSASGTTLWAVAPLANESATSAADPIAITDAVIAKIAEVRGLSCLPLNRTFAAMRALHMQAVRSPADARRLADALGVDAIVVGSVTDYDPYNPPKLGLTLGLYTREASNSNTVDPQKLQQSAAEPKPPAVFDDNPASIVSEHLDAANHEVLMNLQRFAQGRHNPDTALGWRRYTASMDLYTEFAAYWTVNRLLENERLRVGRIMLAEKNVRR